MSEDGLETGEVEESADDALVQCSRHGLKPRAYVCEHLCGGLEQGFVASTENPDNPYPDAWCGACERIRLAHGGWNEASEQHISIRLVCGDCYELIKEQNQ